MTAPGLTPTGYVARTTDQIQTAIETDEEATIDAAIDTSPTQPLGQINGIYASDLGDVEALIAEVYGAQDASNAEGQALDVACALTGTTRRGATSTVVAMSGTASPSTTFTGATLDRNGNVVTPGQILMQIAGHPEFVFTNRDTFTSGPSGAVPSPLGAPVLFVCMQTGPIACNAGTLTVISPSVPGLTSLSNPADGSIGSAIESDASLRARQLVELTPPNGATNDSMRATLKAIKGTGPGLQGVIEAFVFENDLLTTDSNGLPGKSTLAVIWDGASPQAANGDIAQAIWNSKASGIQAWDAGSGLSGVATDSAGVKHTMGFARAAQLSMWINITVAVDSTFDTVNGPAAIQALLTTYGNLLVQGQKVVVSEFIAQALTIKGVRDWTVFQIDSHSTPTNTANIPVTITQIARFDTSRIVVSTTPFT